jgi:DNA-binding beta-propeller fold protein YncE
MPMMKLSLRRTIAVAGFALGGVAALSAQSSGYHLVPRWAKLPAGMEWGEVSAAAVDAKDTVLVFRRSDPPIMEFDRSGGLLKSWGQGLFVWPHGIRVDRTGNIWVTDGRAQNGRGQQVFKFDRSGTLLMTLGTKGVAGEGPDRFNGPCDVAVAANGDIFVADGHVNARVVKFDKNGTFLKAWGKKGSGQGEMSVPHSLALDSRGRVIVTDRGNHRLQVFDAEGNFVDQWTGFGTMPDGIVITADDTMYVADVAEGGDGITIASAKDGKIREKISGGRPEGMAVDSHGTIYGGETTSGHDLKVFARP